MGEMKPVDRDSIKFATELKESAKSPIWPKLLTFWIVTRVWLTLWGLLCSTLYPITPLEKQVPIWPPTSSIGVWLSRLLLAPWDRWDVEHFQRIASVGYISSEGTLAFQPLFPYLGKWVGAVFGGNSLLGMVLVGNIGSFFFLVSLYHLAELDLPRKQAYRAAIYFMSLPAAFILFAPYTESLFLLLSVISLLMSRRGRWWLAGLAGGLASLTRQQGLFLVVPLVWEFWDHSGRQLSSLFRNWRGIAGLTLTPVGYLVWIFYRAIVMNDVVLDFGNPQQIFYGLLLSPNSNKIVENQQFVPPWEALRLAITHSSSSNTVDLLSGGVYLLLLALVGRQLWQLRQSYFLYTIILLVISFSYSTGVPKSYMGLPRHCMLAFPLVMPLAEMCRSLSGNMLITGVGLCFLMALSYFYFCHTVWVP